MNSTAFLLFYEFFKVGLFTFGGGYASLPFLYLMAENYSWFSHEQLTSLIAISGITPGPIGLNMATFAGFETLGLLGAFISSFALVLPMVIITSQVFRLYRKFCENSYVKSVLYVLRPTSCALIASVGIRLFYNLVLKNSFIFSKIDYCGFFLVILLFLLTFKLKRDPVVYMFIAGILGIIFYFLNII